MSKLAIIKPIAITDAMMISSTVPETDYPVWSSGSTYALADRVIVIGTTHKIYESVQASNTNHDPLTAPTWWSEVSATNRWKAFDTINSSKTAQTTSIVYVIRPGSAVSAFSALNLVDCATVRVQMVDPTYGTVYDNTMNTYSPPEEANWWSWFFSVRRDTLTVITMLGLPTYPLADITITLTGGADLAVGVIILGPTTTIGLGTQVGAKIGIQDYSRKETNDYGDIVLTQRAYAKRASFSMLLDNIYLDTTIDTLINLRATPCLWIGLSEYSSTIIYGFYKDFDVSITYSNYSECSLEIEGLT